jgi:hypothetical protein
VCERDDPFVPYAGTIDWNAAMMETQKIGYEGTVALVACAIPA